MGLEDFNNEDSKSGESGDIDNESADSHSQYRNIDSTDLDLIRQHAEDDEHFNTKSRVAIQLHNMGWDVSVEERINITADEYIRADVAAFGGADSDIKLNIPNAESVVVEVGDYNQSKAEKTLDVVDVILWVKNGGSLSDAVVIQSLVPEKSQERFENTYEYVGPSGNEVQPKLDSIHVERYKPVAKEILATFNHITGPSQIVDYINANTDRDIEYEDAEKILSAMGFN